MMHTLSMLVKIDPVLGFLRILGWQWRSALYFSTAAGAMVAVHTYWSPLLRLPALPLAVVGGAIGIFVSFRSNAGYDRWWEGRKLWGSLVNVSRIFATQATTFCTDKSAHERLVRRQIAYVHLLRCALRGQDIQADPDLKQFLTTEELAALAARTSPTHALLHQQQVDLVELSNRDAIDAFRLQRLDESIGRLLDVQGGCERIKNTTFPPGYGYVADRLILAMGLLLPLSLVQELGWYAVPISLLVCLAFRMIGEVGRTLENPFTMFWPALPLYALSKTIEHNLREVLGEVDLPPLPKVNEKGVLL